MFEPPVLIYPKKWKKTFTVFISILWFCILIVVVWGISLQSSSSKKIDNRSNLLPVIKSNQGSQLPSNDIRSDEILGSWRFENAGNPDMVTGNPAENIESVDKLLEGKEIVIPKN